MQRDLLFSAKEPRWCTFRAQGFVIEILRARVLNRRRPEFLYSIVEYEKILLRLLLWEQIVASGNGLQGLGCTCVVRAYIYVSSN